MSDRLTIISRQGGFLRLEIVGRYCWRTLPYLISGEAKRRESTGHDITLTKLELYDNEINDIKPLESLTNLTILSLENNQISDIKPLESLTNLTELYLNENPIAPETCPLKPDTNFLK